MQTAVSASDQIFGLEGGTGIPDLASSSTSDLVPEEERPEESGPGAPGKWRVQLLKELSQELADS